MEDALKLEEKLRPFLQLVKNEYAAMKSNPDRKKTKKDWPLACNIVYKNFNIKNLCTEEVFRSVMGKLNSSLKKLTQDTVTEIVNKTKRVIEVLKPKHHVEQLDLFQSDARRGGFSTS